MKKDDLLIKVMMEYPPSYFLRAPIRISKYLSHSTGPRPFTFSPTVVSVSAAC